MTANPYVHVRRAVGHRYRLLLEPLEDRRLLSGTVHLIKDFTDFARDVAAESVDIFLHGQSEDSFFFSTNGWTVNEVGNSRSWSGSAWWRTDGTSEGTEPVDEWDARAQLYGDVHQPDFRAAYRDDLGQSEIWRTGGTAPITSVPGTVGGFKAAGDLSFFTARTTERQELWRTDGTAEGTILLKQTPPREVTPANSHERPAEWRLRDVTTINEVLFFTMARRVYDYDDEDEEWNYSDFVKELWTSDGTVEGTTLLMSTGAFRTSIGGLTDLGGLAYFTIRQDHGNGGSPLWRSDGTVHGTFKVSEIPRIPTWSGSRSWAKVGDLLFFVGEGELWRSDGTTDGTVLLKDFNRSWGSPILYSDLSGGDGIVLFRVGDQLWKSDGTAEGTVPFPSASPRVNQSRSSITNVISTGGSQFYPIAEYEFYETIGSSRFWGRTIRSSLWRSDGTVVGTTVEPFDSRIDQVVASGGTIWVTTPLRLWRVDVGATIAGSVWRDIDGDGERDVGDYGVPGVTVQLLREDGSIVSVATTDAVGQYRFAATPGSGYSLQYFAPDGGIFTDAGRGSSAHPKTGRTDVFELTKAGRTGLDAGLRIPPDTTAISGMVWIDRNANGRPDAGERPSSGVQVDLLAASGERIATTATNAGGQYKFLDPVEGQYSVHIIPPTGQILGPTGDRYTIRHVNRLTGKSGLIDITSGQELTGVDAGLYIEDWLPRSQSRGYPLSRSLRVTEIGTTQEFIELKNIGSYPLSLDGIRFVDGVAFDFADSDIQNLFPNEYIVVVGDAADFRQRYDDAGILVAGEYAGRIKASGERIELVGPINQEIQDFFFGGKQWFPTHTNVGFTVTIAAESEDPDAYKQPSAWRLSTRPGGTPGRSEEPLSIPSDAIVISEIMTNPADRLNDWIELHNTTDQVIDVSGWFLGDDDGGTPKVTRFQIPAGTVIKAGGFAVFSRPEHFEFGLSSKGETLHLVAADADGPLGYVQSIRFPASRLDVSLGRYVTGTGEVEMVPLAEPTMGRANADVLMGPLVISEIMYHPAFLQDEFIEIYNASSDVLDMNGWFLSGDISATLPDAPLAPGGVILAVPIDPALFREMYDIPAHVAIVGPYAGELKDDDGYVALQQNDTLIDFVDYRNEMPWPPEANLGGASLERIISTATYGNDPASWNIGDRTGGTPGTAVVPRVVVQSAETLVVTEGGAPATFSVILTHQPTGSVELDVNSTDKRVGFTDPERITFTSENWDQAQTIQVSVPADDGFADSQLAVRLRVVDSDDPRYQGITLPDLHVQTLDVSFLRAGDANRDWVFDQLDLIQLLRSRTYGTHQAAGWEEGDFNGDGLFDELDVVAALSADRYLRGTWP